MEKVPALRIVQGGMGEDSASVTIYVTALTLGQLRNHAKVDKWTPDNEGGYQRPLEERRLRAVARYVVEDQGILPTSVLLGTRPQDSPSVRPVDFPSEDQKGVALGSLEIPEGAALWVIDGQHRFAGVNSAFERGGDPQLEQYPFPVAILWNVDSYAEMVHFNIINTTQKKMSTDIVDRHLVKIQERQGLKMVATGAKGEKEYSRATATRIVDRVNDEAGPWLHQIQIPGVPGRDQGLVRQHAFVASLDPFLKDPWVRGRTDDDKVRVLTNFWAAAAEAWPEAFAEPKEHRVQATVGIYSLHMVLPVVIHRCLEGRDLTRDNMATLLRGTRIDSEFWTKVPGNPYTLGTGMSSIRALALHIIERLPAETGAAVKI